MKRILTALIFVFLFTALANAQTNRGMTVVPKNHRYALLIGINDYTKPFEPLKYCDADMEALEKVLLELDFPPENIVRLSTSARDASHLPTKANILRHARLLADEVDESGLFIVAFSGHGASFGDESYFCPMDAANKDLSSLVKRSDVYKIVENCSAKQKLVFVDACRSSLVMDGWKAATGMKGLVDPVGIENPGFFIISSCKKGQFSWEDKKLGHGVFTHFLLEGLRGKAAQDGQISVHGLFSYVNYQTKRYVRLNFEDSQIPLLRGDEDELDDFLIAKITGTPLPASSETPITSSTPLPVSSETPVPSSTPLPASSGSGRTAGERMVKTVNGIDYAFRWCPPGEFMMGGTGYGEKPVHKVKITRGFWLLETEVTQAMWQSVMGKNPSLINFKGDKNPVERISWNDSQEFCKKLSQKLGQRVQLPTEAQWEYACRAGITGDYEGTLSEMAWYTSNSDSTTHAVAKKKPNAWGLYDMHGNVWEWCSDWYDEDYYSESPTSDPTGPNSGSDRVCRGGSWSDYTEGCRSASRDWCEPDNRSNNLGLRVLLVPSQD